MEIGALPLIETLSTAEVAGAAKLSPAAQQLVQPDQALKDYLAILVKAKHFKDAYSVLAAALPQREAAWWASLCIRQSHGAERTPRDEAALAAAVEWVLDPTPGSRKHARDVGQQAGTNTACGCAALAAGATPVPLAAAQEVAAAVSPNSPARLVRRAILLASVYGDARVLAPYPEHFVKLGLSVAGGKHTWKKLVVPASKKH